jgi:hypothetical protein
MKICLTFTVVLILFFACSESKEALDCGVVFQGEVLPISFQHGPNWSISEYKSLKSIEIDNIKEVVDGQIDRKVTFFIEIGIWKPANEQQMNAKFDFITSMIPSNLMGLKVIKSSSERKNVNGHVWRIDYVELLNEEISDPMEPNTIGIWMLGSFQNFGSFNIRIEQHEMNNDVLRDEIHCFIQSLKWSPTNKKRQ